MIFVHIPKMINSDGIRYYSKGGKSFYKFQGQVREYPWNVVPHSELAMHTRAAGKVLDAVALTENRYAYVRTTDERHQTP